MRNNVNLTDFASVKVTAEGSTNIAGARNYNYRKVCFFKGEFLMEEPVKITFFLLVFWQLSNRCCF